MNGGWPGGWSCFSALLVYVSSNPLLYSSSNLSGISQSLNFHFPWSLLGDWLHISRWVVIKIILYIVCFASSLLSLSLSLLVLVLLFTLLSYCLYLNHQVLCFVHSPPRPSGEEGERWVSVSWVLIASCLVKPQQTSMGRNNSYRKIDIRCHYGKVFCLIPATLLSL